MFHSGTSVSANGDLVTNGGRVVVVVTIASELMLAAAKATKACGKIVFDGAQYRTDIAHKGIVRSVHHTSTLQHNPGISVKTNPVLTYRFAGHCFRKDGCPTRLAVWIL